MDRQSSSRNASQVSSRLSRTTSRTLEDIQTARHSRPDSPSLFWQRNPALNPSRPQESVVMSPRQSAATVRRRRATPPPDDKTPTPSSATNHTKSISSRKSLEDPRGSGRSVGFGMDNVDGRQRSSTISHRPGRLSRPSSEGLGLAQSTAAQTQPKVPDPAEEESISQISHPMDVPSSRTSPELCNFTNPEIGEKQSNAPLRPTHLPESPMQSLLYRPPNTRSPAISPPLSPQMYHSSMYGAQPAPYHYGWSSNTNMPGGFYAGAFSHSGQETPQSPSIVNREEHQQILEKVTNVLPDINKLLAHYQETQGQLPARDLMVKQTEVMRDEEIARLRLELDAKKEEYDKLIEKLVGQNYKCKLEIEEKSARIAALEKDAMERSPPDKEFEALKARRDEAISTADAARLAKEDLLAEKLKLESVRADKDEQHRLALEGLKRKHDSRLEAQEAEHNKTASEQKCVLSRVQLELANLITKHSSVKKEVEASKAALTALEQRLETNTKNHQANLAAHEFELAGKAKEFEELRVQHRWQLESQLDSLTTSRQQEIQALHQAEDQKLKYMASTHESNVAELAEEHGTRLTTLQAELEAQMNAFSKLQTEHEQMKAKHNTLAGAMVSWKKRHEEWQSENDKFNKLVETLAHTTDGAPGKS